MSKVAAAVNYRTKTVVVGSCTVVLHRPELTAEARAKREKEVCSVLAHYGQHSKEVAKS